MSKGLRVRLAVGASARALSRTVACCLLGAALFAAGTPARAADGEETVPLDTRILRGLMEQLGLQRDGNGINYEERAPLVIPPGRDLPPPERSGAALAHNPAWPVDPDVTRAKQEAAAERKKSWNADETLRNEQRPLRPDEIAPGPKPRSRLIGDDGYRASPNGSGSPLIPSQLDTKPNFFSRVFGKDKPEISSFTGEPPRLSLTEPPPGYQTPSPDQPYGVGKGAATPKAGNYLQQHGVLEGDK
jgi:hypothetical protein